MLELDSDISNEVSHWFKNTGGDLAVQVDAESSSDDGIMVFVR